MLLPGPLSGVQRLGVDREETEKAFDELGAEYVVSLSQGVCFRMSPQAIT